MFRDALGESGDGLSDQLWLVLPNEVTGGIEAKDTGAWKKFLPPLEDLGAEQDVLRPQMI